MRGQKNINDSQVASLEKLPFCKEFHAMEVIIVHDVMDKGDRLCEYVMPLNI